MTIQEMERLGNPLLILAILHANDGSQPKIHMHMPLPKLEKETYMQLNTCKEI